MKLHPYQAHAVQHLVRHPQAMLHMDMGLGKTIITLSAFSLLQDLGVVRSMLIVAPLRPARLVWEAEARKWDHTRHLSFSYVLGDANTRLRAIFQEADVYVINYENLAWLKVQLEGYLLSRGKYPPWQMIVWDEISKMKNASTRRVREFTSIMPFIARRVGLTGTPASNGLQDLHGQYLMIDDGARLGVSRDRFINNYFHSGGDRWNRRLEPFEHTPATLARKLGDITLQMKDVDYLEMPELVVNDVWVDLPSKAREVYDQIETAFFAELDNGVQLEVMNEASKGNKCLQIADGAAYLVPGEPLWEPIHSAKLEAWEEIRDQLGDLPLLTTYRYKFSWHQLKSAQPQAVNLSETKGRELHMAEASFNTGTLKNLVGHPASIGHGLNLQGACAHIAIIGCTWSLDLYQQVIARVRRQGQKANRVIVHRILARDTLDMAVIERLESNATQQDAIREAIHHYRQSRGPKPCSDTPSQSFL